MRRQPNIFDALDGMSDADRQRIVYGTNADKRDGLIAGIAIVIFYGVMLAGVIGIIT